MGSVVLKESENSPGENAGHSALSHVRGVW